MHTVCRYFRFPPVKISVEICFVLQLSLVGSESTSVSLLVVQWKLLGTGIHPTCRAHPFR